VSGAAAAAPEFRDDRGVTVALAASPRRIVSREANAACLADTGRSTGCQKTSL
jgi:hypothetical protein